VLLLLIGLLTILSLIAYALFDRDVLAPPAVVSLGLLFSSVCAFYNETQWGLNFSSTGVWTIVAGVSAFIIGGVFAVLLANRYRLHRIGFSHIVSNIFPINIKTFKTVIVILFQLFTIVLLYTELRNLTGGSTWYETIIIWRLQEGTVRPDLFTMRLSGLLSICLQFNFAIGLIYAYVVGNNFAAKIRQMRLDWMPLLLSSLLSLMQAYRSGVIRLFIALIVVTYILKKRSVGWKSTEETKKMIKKMGLSLITMVMLFGLLRGAVGRYDDDSVLEHITFYAGTPVASFDVYLQEPWIPSEIWGKETFYALNQNIAVRTKGGERYIFYKEFRQSPNGTWLGNVYTALRAPYHDFGFMGMIVVMFIMGLFFTYFYCKVRVKQGKELIDFRLLLYSYVSYTFFLYFYNCYHDFIALGLIKLVVELYFVKWFLFNLRFKLKF
jgi:oligosaccharide repeat unit polymerase